MNTGCRLRNLWLGRRAAVLVLLAALPMLPGSALAAGDAVIAPGQVSPARLVEAVQAAVEGHRTLYLGKGKTAEQALRRPAMLWHAGNAYTLGGDLTGHFTGIHLLKPRSPKAELDAFAGRAAKVRAMASALRDRPTAMAIYQCRGLIAALDTAPGSLDVGPAIRLLGGLDQKTEPGYLAARAMEALVDGPARDPAAARTWLIELLGRFEALADLDRWLELDCQWLEQTCLWMQSGDLTPQTLSESAAARYDEIATIQSRVEDVLLLTNVERSVWPWVVARSGGPAAAAAARPMRLATVREALTETLDRLRAEAEALDRGVAQLLHARREEEGLLIHAQQYRPLVARLELIQREVALADWACDERPSEPLVDNVAARRLSLVARAGLDLLSARLEPAARRALPPLLTQMLAREYLASYLDLCLYQATVVDVMPRLATRLNRWVALQGEQLTVRGLIDILHPVPGQISASVRADNAYEPRLMKWAAACSQGSPIERLGQARDRVHAFYQQCGYNADEPVYSLRDALDSGLVDCQIACWMTAAVATAAGVEGLVPVRLWRADGSGHTLIGLRQGETLMVFDPLTSEAPHAYPAADPDFLTVETAGPSLGLHVVTEVQVLPHGKRLTREVPYLRPLKAAQSLNKSR